MQSLPIIMSVIFFILTTGFGSELRTKDHDKHLTNDTVISESSQIIYMSDKLIIKKLSPNVYQHVTFLNSPSFGKIPSNGMIVMDKNQALVFDTPPTYQDSEELIKFLSAELGLEIKGVVATHFHEDCLGGLEPFHKLNIKSYGNIKTIADAKKSGYTIPRQSFGDKLTLKARSKKVFVEYFGEGHTRDNVIAYVPDEDIMFGGCLVKELGATKGNLADANTTEWPLTIEKIKLKYPETKIIIPGHGLAGGINLLDYTISLFRR